MNKHELDKHHEWLQNQCLAKMAELQKAYETDDYKLHATLFAEYKVLSDEKEKVFKLWMEARNEESVGRPKLGTKRSVSLTLPDDAWTQIDSIVQEQNSKLGTVIRDLVMPELDRRGINV